MTDIPALISRLSFLHALFVTRGDYGNDWSDVTNATICNEAASALRAQRAYIDRLEARIESACDEIGWYASRKIDLAKLAPNGDRLWADALKDDLSQLSAALAGKETT